MIRPPPKSTLFPYPTLSQSPRTAGNSSSNPPSSGPASPFQSPSSLSTSRSEEHTSELQSQSNLVCRLLLEKKKKKLIRALVYQPMTPCQVCLNVLVSCAQYP